MFDTWVIHETLKGRQHDLALPLFDKQARWYRTSDFNELPPAKQTKLLRWAEREYDNHDWWDDDIFVYVKWINKNFPKALNTPPGGELPTNGLSQQQIKKIQRKRHERYIATRARKRKAYLRGDPATRKEVIQKFIRNLERNSDKELKIYQKWVRDFKHLL